MHKSFKQFTPSGPRLLVERIDMGEKRVGKLVIAQQNGTTRKWDPVPVKVLHPGTGRYNPNTGTRDAPWFKEGDTLVLASWREYGLTVDGRELDIAPEEDVLGYAAIITEE